MDALFCFKLHIEILFHIKQYIFIIFIIFMLILLYILNGHSELDTQC